MTLLFDSLVNQNYITGDLRIYEQMTKILSRYFKLTDYGKDQLKDENKFVQEVVQTFKDVFLKELFTSVQQGREITSTLREWADSNSRSFLKLHPIGWLADSLAERAMSVNMKIMPLTFKDGIETLVQIKKLSAGLPRLSDKIISERRAHTILGAQARTVKILLKNLRSEQPAPVKEMFGFYAFS